MQDFYLRWRAKSGFFVIPGDDLVARHPDRNPMPFHIAAANLCDPDLFNLASIEHDWPKLAVEAHQENLRDALQEFGTEIDVDLLDVGVDGSIEMSLALMSLADGIEPPQFVIETFERHRWRNGAGE